MGTRTVRRGGARRERWESAQQLDGRENLRATLHRVAGPASADSLSRTEDLVEASNRPRTSIAYFVDPNVDIQQCLTLNSDEKKKDSGRDGGLVKPLNGMSVAEYIQWRSGGSEKGRSGIGFTSDEQEFLDANAKMS